MLGFHTVENVQLLDPAQIAMPLQVFQGMLTGSIVKANKRSPRQSSSVSPALMAFKKGTPTPDIRKDGIDHFPEREKKRQRCMYCDSLSYIKCRKGNVWLCLNKDRNCYNVFHGN